jgi:hypothetical protein
MTVMPLKRDNDEERRARLDRLVRQARSAAPEASSRVRGRSAAARSSSRQVPARIAAKHVKKAG